MIVVAIGVWPRASRSVASFAQLRERVGAADAARRQQAEHGDREVRHRPLHLGQRVGAVRRQLAVDDPEHHLVGDALALVGAQHLRLQRAKRVGVVSEQRADVVDAELAEARLHLGADGGLLRVGADGDQAAAPVHAQHVLHEAGGEGAAAVAIADHREHVGQQRGALDALAGALATEDGGDAPDDVGDDRGADQVKRIGEPLQRRPRSGAGRCRPGRRASARMIARPRSAPHAPRKTTSTCKMPRAAASATAPDRRALGERGQQLALQEERADHHQREDRHATEKTKRTTRSRFGQIREEAHGPRQDVEEVEGEGAGQQDDGDQESAGQQAEE